MQSLASSPASASVAASGGGTLDDEVELDTAGVAARIVALELVLVMRFEPGMDVDRPMSSMMDSSESEADESKTAAVEELVEDCRIAEALMGTSADNFDASVESAAQNLAEDCSTGAVERTDRIEQDFVEEAEIFVHLI